MGTNFYYRAPEFPGGLPEPFQTVMPSGEKVLLIPTTEITPADPDNCENYQSEYRWHIGKRSAAGRYCWDCQQTLCESGNSGVHHHKSGWYEKCPECKRDVQSTCCSFSWAKEPLDVRAVCAEHLDDPIIRDEYQAAFTGAQFLAMLEEYCPIQSTDSIGTEFS